MKNYLLTILFGLAAMTTAKAIHHPLSNGIAIETNGIRTELSFYNQSIVRVLKYPSDDSIAKQSLSVVLSPEKVKFTTKETGNRLLIRSSDLQISVDLASGLIEFNSATGEKLLAEKSAPMFTPFDDAGSQTYTATQAFLLEPDEAIYGLGQIQNGKLNQRGLNREFIQSNQEDYTLFFQSIKGYGLFWDNYSPTTFADTAEETSFKSVVADCVDYYFMYGGSADGVIAQMRHLTGDVPMFPLWTYGYWQSKERYKSAAEVTGVVRKYRELGVPLDGIIQDWQYWGSNYLWNAMDFLTADFANPQQMVNDIHDMNAHFIISVWASFGPQTLPYKELQSKNMLLDFKTWPTSGSDQWPPRDEEYPSGVRPYDVYNPEARDIYWRYLNDNLYRLGIDGWWMDCTEPDHNDFRPEDFDLPTWLGSFRKVRNAFPLMTVGGVYDHQRALQDRKRVFILTRSAFAGQQRYGANVWSGDVSSTWDDLRRQVPAGLNFSLSGIPHWNSDIGGFLAGRYNQPEMKGENNPAYHELYLRWLQFGTFTPMMRSHGSEVPREIYELGRKGDVVFSTIEKYIRLRYSLLPYIYSTAWDVSHNRASMYRALVMDFPTDRRVWNMADEFLFGHSLLVAPVLKAQYTTEEAAFNGTPDFMQPRPWQVYLPEGANWYDFWTGEIHQGGQTVTKQTTIDILPLYVRAGSIIPFGPDVQYAMEKNWEQLTLRVYPGADATFILYEDENDNYNYESGKYTEIPIKWDDRNRRLLIGKRQGAFEGMLQKRQFIVELPDGTTKSIEYNGKETAVRF